MPSTKQDHSSSPPGLGFLPDSTTPLLQSRQHTAENVDYSTTDSESYREASQATDSNILAATQSSAVEDEPNESRDTASRENDEEEGIAILGGLQLGLLTFGLSLATFIVALDNTIIATAIPRITSAFNSLDDVGWYGSTYLLTVTALQPSFGRIYTFFNVKHVYLFGMAVFEIGSVLCGAARNSNMFILGRVVAGVGEAALYSGSMTIIGLTVPLNRRPMYLALLSSMYAICSVIGPLIGGVLTDRASWRWCFWINLPLGAIGFAAVVFFFKPPRRTEDLLSTKQKIREIDILGTFTLSCSVICLLVALQWAGTSYPWNNPKVWGVLLGSCLLAVGFIAQQIRRGERATIPPRILGQKTVFWSCLYAFLLSMGTFTHIYYLPFYFQAVRGTSAEGSGIRTIPYLASNIIASIIIAGGTTVVGVLKPFMIFGAAVFTIGSGLIYTLQADSSAGKWIGYQVMGGFGAEAGVQLPFLAVQAVLSQRDMPTGVAITTFFDSLGGALAISVAQNLFYNGLRTNIPKYAPEVPAEVVISTGPSCLAELISPKSLPRVRKAYMEALRNSFVLAVVVGVLGIVCACFVEWRSIRNKKTASDED
ncbi:MFS domain-containing protein [Fusarium falciforme]|uniref:MFS domain-containing protein n=1 Tax=Fusarium falciforme TaxID=195108 RepID=UPI0023003393|nr:MFS domain-containing protein [Fusarium falciforme]WAO93394.1 MFS domain-containing protein [Fusarium falciforme]